MSETAYKKIGYEIDTELPSEIGDDLKAWVIENAKDGDLLLVHADDGVIWGQKREGKLQTSHDVKPEVSPPLRLVTLQELRLFNDKHEIKLWCVGDNIHYRKVSDNNDGVSFDEDHLLWGTRATEKDGFLCLSDGEGLRQIIPNTENLEAKNIQEDKRLCLKVRHYLQENDKGVNSIATSRLVKLGVMPNE